MWLVGTGHEHLPWQNANLTVRRLVVHASLHAEEYLNKAAVNVKLVEMTECTEFEPSHMRDSSTALLQQIEHLPFSAIIKYERFVFQHYYPIAFQNTMS